MSSAFFKIKLEFLVVLLLASVFVKAQVNTSARFATSKLATKSAKKPNIIFILTDDQR